MENPCGDFIVFVDVGNGYLHGFVAATKGSEGGGSSAPSFVQSVTNPDVLDVDLDQ